MAASKSQDTARETIKNVTNALIEALESGTVGRWIKPWKNGLPRNAEGRAYSGINILIAYYFTELLGFSSNVWGTYKQWQASGCQVKAGMKSVTLARIGKMKVTVTDKVTGKEGVEYRPYYTAFAVFNADQVEGWSEEEITPASRDDIEQFLDAANITWGGNNAAYSPHEDRILLPSKHTFHTMGGMYSTAFHEIIHWTGAPKRLNRDLTGRFGSECYAAEELVAELGAAMLCAHFGVDSALREDHAAYLGRWLKVLKETPSALTTMASKASEAMNFFLSQAVDDEEEVSEAA